MEDDVGKIAEATPGAIPTRMERLEEGIRSLHDKLTPIMIEPIQKADQDKPEPPGSDMSASLQIMNELVYDMLKRLEL